MLLSLARSLVIARFIARSIIGAVARENPDGLPRLSIVILVTQQQLRPGVGGLHRKGPVRCAHDQSMLRLEYDDLVGVREAPPKESGHEVHAGADGDRRRCLPIDRLDVRVPFRSIGGVACERRHSATGRSIVVSTWTSTLIVTVSLAIAVVDSLERSGVTWTGGSDIEVQIEAPSSTSSTPWRLCATRRPGTAQVSEA